MLEPFNVGGSMQRAKRPSNAVVKGGAAGTALGALIGVGLSLLGIELPPGSGEALAALVTSLLAWKARGGRKGEAE